MKVIITGLVALCAALCWSGIAVAEVSAEDVYVENSSHNIFNEEITYDKAISITFSKVAVDGTLERSGSQFDIVLSNNGTVEQIIVYSNSMSDTKSTINDFKSGIGFTKVDDVIGYFSATPDKPRTIALRDSDNKILKSICSFIYAYSDELITKSGLDGISAITLSSCPFVAGGADVEFELSGNILAESSEVLQADIPFNPMTGINTHKEVQQMLSDLGYDLGKVDGIWGPRSAAAITKFYEDRNATFDGFVSENEFTDLISAFDIETDTDNPLTPRIMPITEISAISFPEYADQATIIHGINYFDLDNDGRNEVFFCGTTYTNWVDHPVTVLSVEVSGAKDITSAIFGGDVPTSNDCTMIIFADLNADGLKDLVYTDSGMDAPPWTGTAIEVAMNTGEGFLRITNQFEERTFGIRNYSVAAGNLDTDPYGEIIFQADGDAISYPVLQFSQDGLNISENPWVRSGNWDGNGTNMQVADFDSDGTNDLYIGGNWGSPANLIYWGGLLAAGPTILPDTKLGHFTGPWGGSVKLWRGADMVSSAIADFDQDGDLDIVNAYQAVSGVWSEKGRKYNISYGNSYLQILEQTSNRRFENIRPDFLDNLGEKYYQQAFVIDLNHDGLNDIIFNNWNQLWNGGTWATENKFSSTILMNEGNMNFVKFDAQKIFGYNRSIDGIIFPIDIEIGGSEILVLQPYSGDRSRGQDRRFLSYRANIIFN